MIESLIALVILGVITLLANLAERERVLRPLLYMCILGLNALILLTPIVTIFVPLGDNTSELSSLNAALGLGISLFGVSISSLLLFPQVRHWVARFFPKVRHAQPETDSQSSNPQPMLGAADQIMFGEAYSALPPTIPSKAQPETQSSAPILGFKPDSMVHMWALIVTIGFVVSQMSTVFLADGLSGVADSINITYGLLIGQLLILVIIPFMGVGLFIRRGWRGAFLRLGLTKLTWQGLLVSLVTTFGLLMMIIVMSLVWSALVSQETFEQQTEASRALSASITTLGLALMLAISAGVGEEITYRGALQPIFGFWFVTLAFVLSHTQYTLTPATLIILVVAAVFGLIRHYFNTTTAILTHFLYDFVQLAFLLIFRELDLPEATVFFFWWL